MQNPLEILEAMDLSAFLVRMWEEDGPRGHVGEIDVDKHRIVVSPLTRRLRSEQAEGEFLSRMRARMLAYYPTLRAFRGTSRVRWWTEGYPEHWWLNGEVSPLDEEWEGVYLLRLMLPVAFPAHVGIDLAVQHTGTGFVVRISRWLAGGPIQVPEGSKPPRPGFRDDLDAMEHKLLKYLLLLPFLFSAVVTRGRWRIPYPPPPTKRALAYEEGRRRKGFKALGAKGIWPYSDPQGLEYSPATWEVPKEVRLDFFNRAMAEIKNCLAKDLDLMTSEFREFQEA